MEDKEHLQELCTSQELKKETLGLFLSFVLFCNFLFSTSVLDILSYVGEMKS